MSFNSLQDYRIYFITFLFCVPIHLVRNNVMCVYQMNTYVPHCGELVKRQTGNNWFVLTELNAKLHSVTQKSGKDDSPRGLPSLSHLETKKKGKKSHRESKRKERKRRSKELAGVKKRKTENEETGELRISAMEFKLAREDKQVSLVFCGLTNKRRSGTPNSTGSSRSRSRSYIRSREREQDGKKRWRDKSSSRSCRRSSERQRTRSVSPVEQQRPIHTDGVWGRSSVCYRVGTSPIRWVGDQKPTHYRYGQRQLTSPPLFHIKVGIYYHSNCLTISKESYTDTSRKAFMFPLVVFRIKILLRCVCMQKELIPHDPIVPKWIGSENRTDSHRCLRAPVGKDCSLFRK